MLGKQDRQEKFTIIGSLRKLIPDDHILVRVNKVLDLSWLREEIGELYCETNGRPSIDPESAVRLMLAGFFQNIVHDRALMREAHVNIAIRWFAGFGLEDTLPDHSSLTRIRQRWGAKRFKDIFKRTVQSCADRGLVDGKTVHVDATLIRADVSWESLSTEYAEQVLEENIGEDYPPEPSSKAASKKRGRPGKKSVKKKKRSTTDPDATMATTRKDQRLEPTYKQHTAVDDKAGVVVDVELTTGEANEGEQLSNVIEQVEKATGVKIETLTGDGGYAHAKNYALLEGRKTDAVIPPQKPVQKRGRIPLSRFKYDGRHKAVRCPAGKKLLRSSRQKNGWIYRARPADCRACALRSRCFSATAYSRTVLIVDGYEALMRARRRKLRWGVREKSLYTRHKWRAEGAHAEAKTRHGLQRAVRRGMENVAIQAYITAAVMNLKRMAAFILYIFSIWRPKRASENRSGQIKCQSFAFSTRKQNHVLIHPINT